MTTSEKVKLVGLLDKYKSELAERNMKREKDKWGGIVPTKALYNHARIISEKLASEIGDELKSMWEA